MPDGTDQQTGATPEAQLLMISDIEGCYKGTDPLQNTSLCDITNFFNGNNGFLYNFLNNNNNQNHIAFLGDYFDKGSGVVSSIIGIVYLHKTFKNQVHIILGNRDINKFRLAYEFNLKQDQVPDGGVVWSGFNKVDSDIRDYTNNTIDRTKLFNNIMTKSMGAMNQGDDSTKIHPKLDNAKSAEWLIDVFNPLFKCDDYSPNFDDFLNNPLLDNTNNNVNLVDNTKKLFIYSCRYLLKHGKIVEKLHDFSVLMSHAGGFHNCVLQNNEFFDNILKLGINELGINEPYFKKMNSYRVELGKCSESTNFLGITESVELHNGFYDKFIESFFDDSLNVISNEPSNEYFLLQAMGLKPDGNGAIFASYIQSCGGGCGIFTPDKSTYSTFLEKVNTEKIKAIAHGHIPQCMRHPLIFKRKINNTSNENDTSNEIVFIENDTSNGGRPLKINENVLTDIPLSYINKNSDGSFAYGVGVFNKFAKIVPISDSTDKNRNIKNDNDGKTDDDNKKIGLSGPITSDEMYLDEEIQKIIKFEGFKPAAWNPTTPPTVGGKRRTKKNKFSRKYKKRIGKRTKKNHPKKHTCRRCH